MTVFIETRENVCCIQACKKQNVSCETIEIKLSDIDANDDKHQGRVDVASAKKELVDEYVTAMKAGDVFPMVLLQKKGNGRFRVIGGKHRVAAMLDAFPSDAVLKANVVVGQLTDEQLNLVSALENTYQGWRQKRSEIAKVVAATLMRMPLPLNSLQHTSTTIRQQSKQAGCHQKTVTSIYYAKLAKQAMALIGLNGSPHEVVMEEAWRWARCSHWREIAVKINEHGELPRLGQLLKDLRLKSADPSTVATAIDEAAGIKVVSSDLSRYAAQDPTTKMIQLLLRVESQFRAIESAKNIGEEKADEIVEMFAHVRHVMKQWRDM